MAPPKPASGSDQPESSRASGTPVPPEARADSIGVSSRRQWERKAFIQAVQVCELDDAGAPGPEWTCRAVDISRGGIGLRSRRMVHAGRKVFIKISPGRGSSSKGKLLFGVVKQSRYQEGEGFVIGVKFEEIPQTWAITKWLTSSRR